MHIVYALSIISGRLKYSMRRMHDKKAIMEHKNWIQIQRTKRTLKTPGNGYHDSNQRKRVFAARFVCARSTLYDNMHLKCENFSGGKAAFKTVL